MPKKGKISTRRSKEIGRERAEKLRIYKAFDTDETEMKKQKSLKLTESRKKQKELLAQQRATAALSHMHWEIANDPTNVSWDGVSPDTRQIIDADDSYATPHGLVSASYCATAMMSLYLMHQQDQYCDFAIIILPSIYNSLKDPVTYNVHRLIFSTLSVRIQELPKPMIKIGGKVTCEGIESVIEYVYTGRITDIEKLPLENVTQINRAALALGIQLDHYIQRHRNDFVKTSTKVYVGQLHEMEKSTNEEKPTLTVSKVSPSGKLLLMDKCDAESVPVSKRNRKSFSKQAVDMRRKRARESPQQKAIRQEKDRVRKQEFRKKQRELADNLEISAACDVNDASENIDNNILSTSEGQNIPENNMFDDRPEIDIGESTISSFDSTSSIMQGDCVDFTTYDQMTSTKEPEVINSAQENPSLATPIIKVRPTGDPLLSAAYENRATEDPLEMDVDSMQQSLVNGNNRVESRNPIASGRTSANPLEELADSAICP